MSSSRASGGRLDRLAGLEEERRFLLRSLRDLEREHEAGDVDDDDYATLRDGYTVRAAAVLRQIEDGRRRLPTKRQRRPALVGAVAAAVLVGAAGIGFALAQAWGERGANDEITGFSPGDDVRSVLASARAALNDGNLPAANELFFRVVQAEQERGVDNPEALTYYAWTLALGTINNPSADESTQQLELSLLALDRAIGMDENYADPHCFVAIIEFQFRDDADAALPYVEACEANNPPSDMVDLISAFADDIRAAASP